MSIHKVIIHGCWAALALATFFLGALSGTPSPSGDESSSDLSRKPADGYRLKASSLDENGTVFDEKQGGIAFAATLGGSVISSADWESLAQQSIKDSNPISRRLAFSRLLQAMTAENALAMREKLVALGAGGDQWRDFNYQWGALAGRDAFDFAAQSKERDLDAALTGWASANPTEAISLLDNLPEDMRDQRNRFAERVVQGLADRDPNLASDLVLRLAAEGNGRAENLMEMVANETLRSGSPAEAALWSESLPEGPLRAAAMDRVADAYVREDPEAAARWAQQFANQDYAARVIEEVGDGWAERDPVAAVNWLESLPEGRGQVTGLSSVFGDWEDRDPVAASEYLISMPDSVQRDNAIAGFSRGYAWQDPESAIAWAQDISDPGLRQQTLARAGRAYLRRDPDGARAWLPSSGLSAEAQRSILESPRRR